MQSNHFTSHQVLVPRTFTRDKTPIEIKLDNSVESDNINTFPSELFNPRSNPEEPVYRASNIIQIDDEPVYWFLKITDEEWPGEQVHKHAAAAKMYDEHVAPSGSKTIPLVIQTLNPYNTHLSIEDFMNLLESNTSATSPKPPEIEACSDEVELTHVVDERYRDYNMQRRESENELEEFARSLNQRYSNQIQEMVERVERIIENPEKWLVETDITQFDGVTKLDVEDSKRITSRLRQDAPIGTEYQPALEIAFRTTIGEEMSSTSFWSFFIAHRLLMEHGHEYNENVLLTTFQRRNNRGENIIEQITTVPHVEHNDTVFYNTDKDSFIQVDGCLKFNGNDVLVNITDPFTRAEWECLDDAHPASLKPAAPLCRRAIGTSPFLLHLCTSNKTPAVVHKSVFELLLSF